MTINYKKTKLKIVLRKYIKLNKYIILIKCENEGLLNKKENKAKNN